MVWGTVWRRSDQMLSGAATVNGYLNTKFIQFKGVAHANAQVAVQTMTLEPQYGAGQARFTRGPDFLEAGDERPRQLRIVDHQ